LPLPAAGCEASARGRTASRVTAASSGCSPTTTTTTTTSPTAAAGSLRIRVGREAQKENGSNQRGPRSIR
jgi:hypothetical protein